MLTDHQDQQQTSMSSYIYHVPQQAPLQPRMILRHKLSTHTSNRVLTTVKGRKEQAAKALADAPIANA